MYIPHNALLLGAGIEDLVDDAVFEGFLGGHEVIALHVAADNFLRLAGHFGLHADHLFLGLQQPFRADLLNRVLYKCPACLQEGHMEGKGTHISCKKCGKSYLLDSFGFLRATEGETEFSHVPDWYAWERECVRRELLAGTYLLDVPVDICMSVDTKAIFRVGEGRLRHDENGLSLTGCDGKLHYEQKSKQSYTVNSDFNWYELGDVVSVGNNEHLFYCFPETDGDVVAKTRLAAEELYKIAIKGCRNKE